MIPFFCFMTVDDQILAKYYEVINENKQEMFNKIASDRTNYVAVVMENIKKDHNASAILRTCDCFGIQNLYTLQKGVEYEIQREIARGAGNWVNLHSVHGENPVKTSFKDLKQKGYKIIATSPHAEKTIHDIDIDSPMAIVLGTEWQGISEEAVELSDELVKIPMYGFTESFNVSVSAALILNVLRHRLSKESFDWKLSHDEQTALKIEWCEKIVKEGPKVTEEFRRRILEKE